MPPIRFQEVDDDGIATETVGPSKSGRVHDMYLSSKQSGIVQALSAAMRKLFQQRNLPENPAYFLANVLTAFYDRSPVWTLDGNLILREVDASGVQVHAGRTKLCTLGEYTGAWGLPHVMRCISVKGVRAIHSVLVHNLHDSFFRSPQPFRVDRGHLVNEMCTLHGSTLMYNPERQPFPALKIRADVLIRGPSIEDSLDNFAALILCASPPV